MLVIPALDIRAGECAQSAVSADPEKRAQWADPMTAARFWAGCGFSRLHVRDLDADDGGAVNAVAVNSILREHIAAVQVAGGTPSNERIDELVCNGAHLVVTTFESSNGFGSLGGAIDLWPAAIVAGITVRDSRVVDRSQRQGMPILAAIEDLSAMRLAGIVVTSAGRRGSLNGADIHLMSEVVHACDVPVYAAGGIGSRRDLDDLADCGVFGVIIGSAFYTGALDPGLIADEYAEAP